MMKAVLSARPLGKMAGMRKHLAVFACMSIFLVVFLSGFALASGSLFGDDDYLVNPVFYIVLASLWLILLSIVVIIREHYLGKESKKIFFWAIVVPVVLASLYLAGDTVYKNITSETKGPVHWHADYQVWVCGERLDLKDPHYLNNKIGLPLIHEHNDDRIHVEGVVSRLSDISLSKYFEAIGGRLTVDDILYPTESGFVFMENGNLCSGKTGTLKVYVNGKRIEQPEDYVIYPSSYVPPGDCIIVSFDEQSQSSGTTDKICDSWAVKGWSYQNFDREKKTIGDRSW
jgi:hypothetical protein